jgi:succinyl-diaminopimelate desuccinylase
MDVDIRYLPNQDPDEVLRQVRALGVEVVPLYELPSATLDPRNRYVEVLRRAATQRRGVEAQTVGRDGASDAVFYLARGIPAVEFGPLGAGHHGPDEHVDVESLRVYRGILVQFLRELARVG